MRDHLLGSPGIARAVQRVLEPDEFDDWSNVYGLGIPTRVLREVRGDPPGWAEAAKRWQANKSFRTGNHTNPDGSITPLPEKRSRAGTVMVRGRVQEQAAAALAVPLRARTAVQAADRMAEAFSHMEAAKG